MVNQKLRAAREKKHWSMETAAEKIGVSKTSIARWENGEQKPRGASLDLVCTAYGMNAEELGLGSVGVENHPIPIRYVADSTSTPKYSFELEKDGSLEVTRRAVLTHLLQATSLLYADTQIFFENQEPWERLMVATTDPPATMNTASFEYLEEIIKKCWHLSDNGELIIAEKILSTFLPKLIQLAPYQQESSGIIAKGLQLHSILAAHRLQLNTKLTYCQQAVKYAKLTNDYDIIATALNELMVAFRYTEQHGKHDNSEKALRTCEENLSYCHKASPLVQARTYREAAIVLARYGRKKESLFYCGMADEVFPNHPENDPNFWFADCGIYTLLISDILVYLELRDGKQAWNAFDIFRSQHPALIIPKRVELEIINHLGRATIMVNDVNKYAQNLKDGLSGAIALKSKKRLEEVWNIYAQEMPKKWFQEPEIKQVVEQFQLPRVQ